MSGPHFCAGLTFTVCRLDAASSLFQDNVKAIIKGGHFFIMQITDVRVRKISSENSNKMKAIASITIDGVFVVHDIKILEGEKGMFIAMPSRKSSDGEFRDIAHPINTETREMLQRLILEKYNETAEEQE